MPVLWTQIKIRMDSHCRNFAGSADLLDPGLLLNATQEKKIFAKP
jgi:hypothetical protein